MTPAVSAEVVFVHESSSPIGGSQRVLAEMRAVLPDAPLLAADLIEPGQEHLGRIEGATPYGPRIHKRHFSHGRFGRLTARLDLDAKLVVSVVGAGWGMTAAGGPRARHLSYFSGPTPALHTRRDAYIRAQPVHRRALIRAAGPLLRRQNRRQVSLPDRLLVPSRFSCDGIARIYGRDAEVLHPPVRTDFFTPGNAGESRAGLIAVARLVRHKSLQLAIEAARHAGQRLTVVGTGSDAGRLRRLASGSVTFAGPVGDDELRDLYRGAAALIHPPAEEFGIVMAEAHACGTPVVAPRAGGALAIVNDGVTGALFEHGSPESASSAIRKAIGSDPAACRRSAERFAAGRFRSAFRKVLDQELAAFRRADRPDARAQPLSRPIA